MNGQVGLELANGVAVVTLDHPPLNTLGQELRAGIAAAVEQALAAPEVDVILLRAAGRSWPVGADIREFGKPPVAPALPDLCTAIAAAPKPVIAALHGSALGGGLELALVAAYRVAAADLRLGLPEVTLGILPGAGGTQRLPRLIGAAAALDMILSGAPVTATEAHRLGLVDLLAPAGVDDAATAHAAFALALKLAQAHVSGQRRLHAAHARPMGGSADVGAYLDAVQVARARRFGPHERAAPRIIDCVESALLLPEAQGLALERAAFLDLVTTPEARALRHAFMSERRGAKSLPKDTGASAPKHVALAGSSRMAAGLAGALLGAGVRVTLMGDDSAGLARVLTRLAKAEEAAVATGAKTDTARKAAWERIAARPGDTSTALQAAAQEHGEVDLLIECGPPDELASLATRRSVFSTLAGGLAYNVPVLSVLPPHGAAVLARDPLALAAADDLRNRLAVLAMTAPYRKMALTEVALNEVAAIGPAGAALQLFLRTLGWRAVRQGPIAGFLGPRLATALADAADRCLAAGAAPHTVDVALRQAGLPAGPFESADLAGTDDWIRRYPDRRADVAEADVARQLREALAAVGRTGRRSGRGWHDHPASGPWKPSAEVMALADGLRPHARLGTAALWRRVLAGMANDAAWALAEGRARQPSDIDLVALAQGFPRWLGGPMQAADEAGLLGLRNDLRTWAKATGDTFWAPAPLWDELIREGRRFADLNAG
ncbi:MAG TPA: enoyl-CoA hydratase-related protein [Paracoccaceae bacterium]|nr:enoyl-CoA hydratase-related protein [Paracoccaceae bacterium]